MVGAFLLGLVLGGHLVWVFLSSTRRRGSNPAPPGRKPAPPAGPPEQPLTAQLIRYWAREGEQVRRALGLDDPIRMDEGQTQRSHGNGGPTTPKLPIKPQPTAATSSAKDRCGAATSPAPRAAPPTHHQPSHE